MERDIKEDIEVPKKERSEDRDKRGDGDPEKRRGDVDAEEDLEMKVKGEKIKMLKNEWRWR